MHPYFMGSLVPSPTLANKPRGNNMINIHLEERDLWNQFHIITNEMILTKAGRRTFPLIKIRINGLDDNELYTVQIEFCIADQFKYRFLNGEWKSTLRNDPAKSTQNALIHQHPDSPNFGHHWGKDLVIFGKLKLTNCENSHNTDAVYLKSLNKYRPTIHILKHDKNNVDDTVPVFSKTLVETEFIAVTAYQNENITALKIKHNPFAKAFLANKPTLSIESEKISIISPTTIHSKKTVQLVTPVLRASAPQITNNQHLSNNFYYSNSEFIPKTNSTINSSSWYHHFPIISTESQSNMHHYGQPNSKFSNLAETSYSTSHNPNFSHNLYYQNEKNNSLRVIDDSYQRIGSYSKFYYPVASCDNHNQSTKRPYIDNLSESYQRPSKRINQMELIQNPNGHYFNCLEGLPKEESQEPEDSSSSNENFYPFSSSDQLYQSSNSSSIVLSSSIVS